MIVIIHVLFFILPEKKIACSTSSVFLNYLNLDTIATRYQEIKKKLLNKVIVTFWLIPNSRLGVLRLNLSVSVYVFLHSSSKLLRWQIAMGWLFSSSVNIFSRTTWINFTKFGRVSSPYTGHIPYSGQFWSTYFQSYLNVFSSHELKAQVSFSDRLSSIVCLSVCL